MQKLKGHVIRDAFEKVYKGRKILCGECGKPCIIGMDSHVVYSEMSTPFIQEYRVWGIHEKCGKTKLK